MSRYKNQLRSAKWKRFADDVKRRDGYRCVECGCDTNLQVHHKIYYSDKKPWEYTIDLLETLCCYCHHSKHADTSISEFIVKDKKQFKKIRREERKKYREINEKNMIYQRGMTTKQITEELKIRGII